MVRITLEQVEKVNTLVRDLCCNYDEGNCLLLDDEEAQRCIQEISCSKIMCNYFLNAVLPANKKLHGDILQHNKEI